MTFRGLARKLHRQNVLNRVVPIRDIDSLVRHRTGVYKQILKVTDPLNIDLMGKDELEQAVDAVQGALNTNRMVGQTCQILITSDPVDIDTYLWDLGQKIIEAKERGESYKVDRLKNKVEYLEEHRYKARNVHNFYLVLESRSKKREQAEVELQDQTSTVVGKLAEVGMKMQRIGKEQAQKIIYQHLSPTTHLTRPYRPGMDLMQWKPHDIQDHGSYVEMDHTFYRFYTLSYIPLTRRAGWLDPLLYSPVTLDISVTLSVTSKADMIKSLNGKVTEFETKKLSHIPESAKQYYDEKIDSTKKLIREIRPEKEQLFKTTFMLAVRDETLERLNSSCERFESALADLEVKKVLYKGTNLLWYFLPIGHRNEEVERRYHWPLYARLAASMLPFNSSEVNYNRGILKGFNVKTDAPVLVYAWDKSLFFNRNEFWIGRSGSGKTFGLKNEIHREYYAGEAKRQILIDIERDYHDAFPWANRIIFRPGADYCTNPFHIRSYVVDTDNEGEDLNDLQAYLPKKISDMKSFFRWIYPDMSVLEEAKLSDAMAACFREVGLFYRKPGEAKVHLELPERFPTLSDLDERLKNMEGMEDFRTVLKPYVDGEYATIFNGQTNWDMEDPMNILDIHDLSKSVQKPLMDLLLGQIWEEIKRDRDEKMLLVIDELGLVADERNPLALEFVHDMAKRIRKYGGGLIVATQNVSDFLASGRWGTAIINNCEFQHFLGLKSQDIKMLTKELEMDFSAKELKILKKDKAQGHGIFILKDRKRIEMQTDCSPDELEHLGLDKAEDTEKETTETKNNVVAMVR